MMRVVERWYLAPGVTVHEVEVGRLRGHVFVPAAHHGALCLPAAPCRPLPPALCPYSWPAPARYSGRVPAMTSLDHSRAASTSAQRCSPRTASSLTSCLTMATVTR